MLGDVPLPGITRFVIAISDGLTNNWLLILIVLVVAFVGWKVFAMTAAGRNSIDRWKLYIPLFGPIQLKSAISRFTRTLGTLVTSGVPILQALKHYAGNLGKYDRCQCHR